MSPKNKEAMFVDIYMFTFGFYEYILAGFRCDFNGVLAAFQNTSTCIGLLLNDTLVLRGEDQVVPRVICRPCEAK